MVYTGADLFIDILERYGVDYIFGNPGTTELPLMRSLEKSNIKYILGLHEDIAVGVASGYANTLRNQPNTNIPIGVVNLHLAPGLAHGLGNIHGAKFAGSPLIITAGNHSTDFRHEEPSLRGNLLEMVDQFTKWSIEVLDPDTLPDITRRAVRTALTPPMGPVFMSLPMDVMMEKTTEEPSELGEIPNAGSGDPNQIKIASELLVEAKSPVMIVGDKIARSGIESVNKAVELAETLGCKVYGEILTSEVNFPTDHNQWISHIPPDEEIVRSILNTDTVMLIGCSTNTTLFRHEKDIIQESTKFIHINNDFWNIGKNEPAHAAIFGDPSHVMEKISNKLKDKISKQKLENRLKKIESEKQKIQKKSKTQIKNSKKSSVITKEELIDSIKDIAKEAYIVDEGVTSKYVLLDRKKLKPKQLLSNKGGGLGYGLPASIGASLAEKTKENRRNVLGFIGDGSYLYYPHSLYTASRYDIDLTIIIADNRNYHALKKNMVGLYGEDEKNYDFLGMDIDPPVDFIKNAESNGARGHLIDSLNELNSTLKKAINRKGIDVLDVLIKD